MARRMMRLEIFRATFAVPAYPVRGGGKPNWRDLVLVLGDLGSLRGRGG